MCFLFALVFCLMGLEKAHATDLVLDWNASSSPNVTGYYVYYGTTSGIYSYKVDAGNGTTLTITNLAPGTTYYFAATAYDADGDESAYSSEVSYLVPGMLTLTSASGAASPAVLQFSVEPGHSYEIQATTDLQTWTSIWQSDVAVSNVWMQFVDPDMAAYPSRFYRLVSH